MFLRAGVLSLALLLGSRLLGLVRESAQAAAFGATGLGDIAVLMLTLPDWLSGVFAAGALSYVLLPAWAHEEGARIAAMQRRIGRLLLLLGLALGAFFVLLPGTALRWLAPGLSPSLLAQAGHALAWSGVAVPMALLAALGATRLQHERDFVGLYGANLVVNAVLTGALAVVALRLGQPTLWLGVGLLLAMGARLAWQQWRQRPFSRGPVALETGPLPALPVWLWAAAAAGLPLALPFAARSLASQEGAGALATFNYAWKLVELPLVLAVQVVGALALGPIAQAVRASPRAPASGAQPMRRGFALAWTLACACAAGLLVAAPAVAQLLFGWGRMQPEALQEVARWGGLAAWVLPSQALLTIALAVLAAQERMRIAVAAYAAALAILLLARPAEGAALMVWLDLLWAGIAAAVLLALRAGLAHWLPWRALAAAGVGLLAVQALLLAFGAPASLPAQWALAIAAALAICGLAWLASGDLREALAR